MNLKFEELVRELDEPTLQQLRQTVAAEVEERRQKTAIKVEEIGPGMTPEQRREAVAEIARALRGEQ